MKSLLKLIFLLSIALTSFAKVETFNVKGKLLVNKEVMNSISLYRGQVILNSKNSQRDMFVIDKKHEAMKDIIIEILQESNITLLENPTNKIENQIIIYEGEKVKLVDALAFISFLDRCGLGFVCDDEDDLDKELNDSARSDIKEQATASQTQATINTRSVDQ